ncbi:acyltransferase [Mycolicibacterium madagascariense]|nr:acyltransferase [Mycolicibacterium madagascariense]
MVSTRSRGNETGGKVQHHNVFRRDVHGLRAVAVLAVVLFHAGVPGVGGGFVGVDVFFVISGFVITGLLWREASATGTIGLRRFYGARARRLLPTAAVVAVVTMIASAILLSPLQVRSVGMDGIASALYLNNYVLIGAGVNYFGKHDLVSPSPFQHCWSLGVEEQFYLVWPLLIVGIAWVVRRVRRVGAKADATVSVRPFAIVLAVVAVLSFGSSVVLTYVIPPVAFYSLPTRAWQLALGGMVALTASRWRRLPFPWAVLTGVTGLLMIGWAATRFDAATHYPGVAAAMPALGAALIIGAGGAAPTRGVGLVLGSPRLRRIGDLSYSWYLWHWPVLVLAPVVIGHPLGLTARLAAVLLSAGLAALTLRLVENPLRFAPRIRRSPWASLTLGGASSAVAVCVCAAVLVQTPDPVGRGPATASMVVTDTPIPPGSDVAAFDAAVRDVFGQVQAAVAASLRTTAVPSNLNPPLTDQFAQQLAIAGHGCLVVLPFDDVQPDCTVGDLTSSTSIALVGDSRAAMLDPAFQRIATQRHWRLQMMAKAGCSITDLPVASEFNGVAELFDRCPQWRSQVMARLAAAPPDLIVVSSARAYDANGAHTMVPGLHMYDHAWLDSLTRLVRALRATGARVLVLGPTPDPPAPVPQCLSAHLDDALACAPTRRASGKDASGMAAESTATGAGGGQYADLTALFCASERCPVIVGNTMVYFDSGHLTHEYSELLAPAMGALVERALAGN